MLNRPVVLFVTFCFLFVADTAFGQEQSDSHIITVTKKIDVAKLNENVEDLNEAIEKLNTTVGTLNTTVGTLNTTVEDLDKTVVRIDERTKGIVGWQYAIFGMVGAIFASLLVLFVTLAISYFRKRNGESETTSTIATQVSQSEAVPTQTTHESTDIGDPTLHELVKELLVRLDTLSVERVSSRHSSTTSLRGEESIDDLKSDDYATMEKV